MENGRAEGELDRLSRRRKSERTERGRTDSMRVEVKD